jgi:predicted alpha/beta superfamily hydrolase
MSRISRLIFICLFVINSSNAQKSEEKKEDIKVKITENFSTKTNNVTILKNEFIIKNLNDISHKIWVYLPPDYHQSKKNYPVIYMHDAQNLFDRKTSYAGEWEIDETLNTLYKKTGKSFIVIGIENGGEKRIEEYTPWPNRKYGGGKGAIYIDFIVETLKPYIDKKYRTKPERKATALIGSSLGGLISYYGGLKHPKTFSKIGAFSTSFWFSANVHSFTKEKGALNKSRIYFIVGEKEGRNMIKGTEKTIEILKSVGFPFKNITKKIVPEGVHNEALWKSEFLNAITFLYKL